MSSDVFFSLLAPKGASSFTTAADKAVALLDEALQRCPGSSSSYAAGNQPKTSTSGTAASWSQPQPQFVAIHIEDMTPEAAHNRQSAPCNKVCWRVTSEASGRPGPVCPAAPTRPRPRTVLLPANEVHCLWNNL